MKKVTVVIDWANNVKYLQKAMKKFNLSWKVKTPGLKLFPRAEITGTKKDIIKYLSTDYYEDDLETVKDLYPELFVEETKKLKNYSECNI